MPTSELRDAVYHQHMQEILHMLMKYEKSAEGIEENPIITSIIFAKGLESEKLLRWMVLNAIRIPTSLVARVSNQLEKAKERFNA